jgi:hypothetical protein
MKLSPGQLMTLISDPKRAISQILRQSDIPNNEPLPEQLRLFEGFFGASDR